MSVSEVALVESTMEERVKKLPGEVYFFVVIWLLFVPALALYFVARIVYVNIEDIDPETIANIAFLWPVMVIVILTMLLIMQFSAYVKYKRGFFSAWIEMFWITIGK